MLVSLQGKAEIVILKKHGWQACAIHGSIIGVH